MQDSKTFNFIFNSGRPIVKNKIISREIKIKIYKTLIRPIITYGTETWVLNKNTCKQLAVFERKILRRIFGAIETVDRWRARYNEIYELYKESDLEAHIRCQRLRWLGHVTRMETTRKVKVVFNNNPDGTRLRGRLRTKWWNCVRVDVNRLGIRNWRELAMDREGWKRAIEEVKAHLGCNTEEEEEEEEEEEDADDMALLAEEEMILKDMLLELNDSCDQYGMKINANTKKTMVIGRKIKKINLLILSGAVKQVDSFKYLGCTISSNMSCSKEVKRRIAMAKEAFKRKRPLAGRANALPTELSRNCTRSWLKYSRYIHTPQVRLQNVRVQH
ncbi:hypothetical protein ANN_12778 [Periplaneta americana]|uniref:Endonuclease-reverse transcriptase n=1 Tax=Periplaneta americana TaxID=6978 RepID=A0ABQ8TJH8_PERAM|nr:hypothetical protein ANN_12778 [Periplaneta americana]